MASSWCLAEIGAFWGGSKRVISFIADPEIGEAELPAQLKTDVWTRNVGHVLESIRGLSPTVFKEVLTRDLVLLLRYLQRDGRPVLPENYGKALAVENGAPKDIDGAQLLGWQRAVRYGLLHLVHHGLVDRHVDTVITYGISDYGKDVLAMPQLKQRYREVVDKEL